MSGFRTTSKNADKADGLQRLNMPGWPQNAEQARAAAQKSRSDRGPSRLGTFLSDNWGKVAMGTAAALVVGAPLLNSHFQLQEEHPEFSALSIPGIAQRVHRTGVHLDAAFDAAYYRTPSLIEKFKATVNQANGPALAPYAVVCFDEELLARAQAGQPHAKAYLAQARETIAEQVSALSKQDAIFYKTHVQWNPDMPVPAAAFDLNYNKMWYPKAPVDLKAPRPVSQWVVERGTGICPTGKVPYKRDLKF